MADDAGLAARLKALRERHAAAPAARAPPSPRAVVASVSTPPAAAAPSPAPVLPSAASSLAREALHAQLALPDATAQSTEPDDADIAALLEQTRDELRLSQDDDAALSDDAELDGLSDELNDQTSGAALDVAAEARALGAESAQLQSDATQLLKEEHAAGHLGHSQDGAAQDTGAASRASSSTAPQLERLPRSGPELVRGDSGTSASAALDAEAEAALEDELAAAMGDMQVEANRLNRTGGSVEGRGSSPQPATPATAPPSGSGMTPSATSSASAEPSAASLLERFSRLRSNITAPMRTTAGPSTPAPAASAALSLPSPPAMLPDPDMPSLPAAPSLAPPDATADDIHKRHGIEPGRNLGAFEQLVRLDAKALAEPGTAAALSSRPKALPDESDSDEDDEIDSWCCICNADASLQCAGCDHDPYCSACWAEGHATMARDELREHRTRPFESRKAAKRRARARRRDDGPPPPGRRAMAA
ncbi:hypothetical protein FA09DRAFT_329782 [Tilletiopsis washingtonensis]|uniref:Uncharacterized protein n=1 Tax=Tilletiopsis washingtonensis TaxID=58919 RepID=A0A316ZB54_9BASI|nr:hypothetical protein FA09DRAFT_329782 [Tilletiopsis washingtonensis]PWN98152.1 hypothetical protein FA09DRAFT_329782 [Tilletiopsis washingtonensis]